MLIKLSTVTENLNEKNFFQAEKKKTSFNQLEKILENFSKESISGLEKCIKNDTYISFINSNFNCHLQEFMHEVNYCDIPEETKKFFMETFTFYNTIYKIALNTSPITGEEISENYIKIDKKKIQIELKTWNKLFECLIRVENNTDDKTDNLHQNKTDFKKMLRITLNDLIQNDKDMKEHFCKSQNVNEELYKKKLLELNIEEKEIKDYVIETSYLQILIKLIKVFLNTKNIIINEHKFTENSEKLDYIVDQLFTVFIICLQKQKEIQNGETHLMIIPLVNLQEKLGGFLIDLISFYIYGLPHFIFDWKDENFINLINEMTNSEFLLLKNKKSSEKEKSLLQKFLINTEIALLDSDFCQILIQTILLKSYKHLDEECLSFIYKDDLHLTNYQKNLKNLKKNLFDKSLINKIERSLIQKKIKIGANLLNHLRIKMPYYIGKTEKIIINKKKFPMYGVEIKNCFEILTDICRINRPFLISKSLLIKENFSYKYNQAYLQRILNFVHNNKNGSLKINTDIIQISKNHVDNSALLIFLYSLLNEFKLYNKNLVNTCEMTEILANMPLILSLYYLNSEEILKIYDNTNTDGKMIIRNLVILMTTFDNQAQIEKTVDEMFFHPPHLIKNMDAIKNLYKKITGIKYSFLLSIKESIFFCNFGFFYIPFFMDSRGRHYYNNKGLHMQSHYMIRGIVKIYNDKTNIKSNKMLMKVKEILKETAINDLNILHDYKISNIKSIMRWIDKYELKKNEDITLYNKIQKQLIQKQFLSSLKGDLDFENFELFTEEEEFFNTTFNFIKNISLVIQFINKFIKSTKKLTLKIIEFFCFIDNIFGKPDYILEYDAVSNGLQMQSITIKSETLGKYSKLIEGHDIDIYTMGVHDFNTCMNSKIKNITNSYFMPFSNFEDISKEIIIHTQICINLKREFKTEKKNEKINTNYYKKETRIFAILLRIIKKTKKHLDICIKELKIFIQDYEQFNEKNIRIQNLLQHFFNNLQNNINLYKLIIDISFIIPSLISFQDFCYITYLYQENIKNSIFYNYIKLPIQNLIENNEEISQNLIDEDIIWFIDSYRKKCQKFLGNLGLYNVSLTNTHIFKIRVFLLNFHNSVGDDILKLTNKRDIWKFMVMTSSYNSTSFGRITANYDLIKKEMINVNKNILKCWADLYEDFFLHYFQPRYLKDTEIFKDISQEVANFVKRTNYPIILQNEFVTYTMSPKKYTSARVPLNSYKKQLRGYMLNYNFPTFDVAKNDFLLDSEKVKTMFGPTYCHMLDAFIVITLLKFINNLNDNLKKNKISYRFSIEPNHDSFRSNNIFFLEMILEYGYIYLIESDYFTKMFKDMPFYADLLKIIEKKINKEEQRIYMNKIVSLAKGFVKF